MILYLNIVANTFIAVLMDYCWWIACVCGPAHLIGWELVSRASPLRAEVGWLARLGGSLVWGSTSSCKTEVWCCTILILGTQMLPNLHQYSHDCMSRLLLNYCLYCFFSLGTAVKLEKKKKKKKLLVILYLLLSTNWLHILISYGYLCNLCLMHKLL